jgi:hypothetical protein
MSASESAKKRERPTQYVNNPSSSQTENVVHLYVWVCIPKFTRIKSFTPLFGLFSDLIENSIIRAEHSGLPADRDHPGFNVTVNRQALDEAVKNSEQREMLDPFITWMIEQQWCSEAQTEPVVGEGAPAEQNLGVAALESVQQTVVPPGMTAVAMSPDRSCELKTQIETARLRTLESEMRAAQAQERAAEAEAQAAEAAAKAKKSSSEGRKTNNSQSK